MVDYNTIKSYYDRGLWNDRMVKMAVIVGRISPVEYKAITGQTY